MFTFIVTITDSTFKNVCDFGSGGSRELWLQCLQRCHGHKQLHGIVGQRQEEVERLIEGQCVVVEHIEDDAHGGQALRVARYLIGMP